MKKHHLFNSLVFIAIALTCTDLYAQNRQIENISFESHGVTLRGSIAFPQDNSTQTAIVFVDGSGKNGRRMAVAEAFARDGITALVYDKRGAGASGGEYEDELSVSEANLTLLVDDAVAAMQLLHKHPRNRMHTIGLVGESQGGWIVPLAAQKSNLAQFMVLWSGPVCKTSEEDLFSRYTQDRDFDTAPSFASALAARATPYVWPDIMGRDTDPFDSLKDLSIPGLWIFGAKDGSIPVDLSISRLHDLQKRGKKDYQYILFSGLGHNTHWTSHATVVSWIKDTLAAKKQLADE